MDNNEKAWNVHFPTLERVSAGFFLSVGNLGGREGNHSPKPTSIPSWEDREDRAKREKRGDGLSEG